MTENNDASAGDLERALKLAPLRADRRFVRSADDEKIAAVDLAGFGRPLARLFAASPELLSACREASSLLTRQGARVFPTSKEGQMLARITAAIAKAEGRP